LPYFICLSQKENTAAPVILFVCIAYISLPLSPVFVQVLSVIVFLWQRDAVLTAEDDGDASDAGEIAFRRPDKKLRYGFHAIRGKRQ